MSESLLAFFIRLITGVRVADVSRPLAPRVYYANHSSHLDFVVIWAALPANLRRRARPVAAADYWNKGPLRRWLATKVFHSVLIPRGKVTRDDDPIGAMSAVLDEGNDLIIFPEGTRSEDGGIAPFRAGIHALAHRRPGLELVPVYLENLNRILPKGEFLMVPLMGNAVFGEPASGPFDGETRAAFLARMRESLIALGGPAVTPLTTLSHSDEPGS